MDLNKIFTKDWDTAISFDEKQKMYHIEMWIYSHFADSIYYNFKNIKRIFWDFSNKKDDFSIEDLIISKSEFLSFVELLIFDLKTNNKYTLISKDYFLSNFIIKWQKYFILIYLDIDSEIKYITDFKEKDFEIIIEKNNLKIFNSVFKTEVLSQNFELSDKQKTKNIWKEIININNISSISICDFYLFDDIIWNTDFDNYKKLFIFLNGKKINIKNDEFIVFCVTDINNPLFPALKIEMKYIWKESNIDLSNLQKIFYAFYYKFYLALIIKNKNIEDFFIKMPNISEIDFINWIDKFSFENQDIYSFDEKSISFFNSFNYLKYLLYILNGNLLKIDSITQEIDDSNPHYNLLKQRNIINKEALVKNISYFENVFKKYLELIKNQKT